MKIREDVVGRAKLGTSERSSKLERRGIALREDVVGRAKLGTSERSSKIERRGIALREDVVGRAKLGTSERSSKLDRFISMLIAELRSAYYVVRVIRR